MKFGLQVMMFLWKLIHLIKMILWIEKYELSPEELKEYENIKMTTSTLMFNGRPASENDKIELEKILKDFFC